MDPSMNIDPPLHGFLLTKMADVFSAAEALLQELNPPPTAPKALAFSPSSDAFSTFRDSTMLLSKASMSATMKA